MDKLQNQILSFIEPIFRFCYRRVSNRYDAEDLASEIICHVLDGFNKYEIQDLEVWVWRIAHNRYARFVDAEKKRNAVFAYGELSDLENMPDDHCEPDEEALEEEYASVFRYLHTLSAQYRNIFVDYYVGELSVRQLSQKYYLPETTIKWRLNVGRDKIRKRMGENGMDKIYQRINWNTTCCNGSIDVEKYLGSQIARAICKAAYEKPLTVEEISLCTGIPAMYIEDELPKLEYGDAIVKVGDKYATDFIVFSLENRRSLEREFESLVEEIADYFEEMLRGRCVDPENCQKWDIDKNNFGVSRLGSIIVPYILRKKIREIQNNKLQLTSSNYPPRKDGGYGWFIVEETVTEEENIGEYATGCNSAGDDSGNIYYYWSSKYFDSEIYQNGGIRFLCAKGIVQKCVDGRIPEEKITEEQLVGLIRKNLVVKDGNGYRLKFPCFTKEQFAEFVAPFESSDLGSENSKCFNAEQDARLNAMLEKLILAIHKGFKRFVPKRLDCQINQWVTGFTGEIIGYVLEELFERGILEKPEEDKPFVNGVFYVDGEYMNI